MNTLLNDVDAALSKMCERREFFSGWADLLRLGERAFNNAGISGSRRWLFDATLQNHRDTFHGLIKRHRLLARSLVLTPSFAAEAGGFLRKARSKTSALLALILAADQTISEHIAATDMPSVGDGPLAYAYDPGAEEALLVRLPLHSVWGRQSFGARNPVFYDILVAYVPTSLNVQRKRFAPVLRPGQTPAKPCVALVVQPLRAECFTFSIVEQASLNESTFHFPVVKSHDAIEALFHASISADITLLPEMVVGESDVDQLRIWFGADTSASGRLLVAGSGHIKPPHANRACIIEGGRAAAEPFASHYKKYPFSFVLDKVPDPHFKTWIESQVNSPSLRLTEHLERTSGTSEDPLIVVDTRWGRLVVVICRDLLGASNTIVMTLIAARVDYIFVPTASFADDAEFVAAAGGLCDQGAAVFINNSFPFDSAPPYWRVFAPPKRKDSKPKPTSRVYTIPSTSTTSRSKPVEYVEINLGVTMTSVGE